MHLINLQHLFTIIDSLLSTGVSVNVREIILKQPVRVSWASTSWASYGFRRLSSTALRIHPNYFYPEYCYPDPTFLSSPHRRWTWTVDPLSTTAKWKTPSFWYWNWFFCPLKCFFLLQSFASYFLLLYDSISFWPNNAQSTLFLLQFFLSYLESANNWCYWS